MKDFSTQSSFSRTLYNDAKLGAYYTDKAHCRRMGNMIELLGEVCVLEPCCGDASALNALLSSVQKAEGGRIYTYGVEMQKDALEKAELTHKLWADFLNGTRITKNVFSLCFSNPPYGEKESKTERLETDFIESIYPLMTPGGLFVAVLPLQALKISSFIRSFSERFSFEKSDIYRFDDAEYAKFHQLAIFARRRARIGVKKDELDENRKLFEGEADSFDYLPSGDTERKYKVNISRDEKIESFAPYAFDAESAIFSLSGSSLYRKAAVMCDNTSYKGLRLGNPPCPLKKDLLYLTAVAGGGQGKAGSIEEGNFHLQRGTVKPVTETNHLYDEKGNVIGVEERTHSQITMNIIEPSGKCTSLIGTEGKEETA